ncbi:MAG: hypothetical protein ASARMPREDX12_007033 [Alectoria sarmentosa]|nr:MAG: hypothetical protein ASARMPREDX12_007033 [Alectoria sarmentosa]
MASIPINQTVFPFFGLSPEVRNIIYSFALTASSLRTRRTNAEKRWTRLGLLADCPKKRNQPCFSLLLVNHQIYHEASHILYNHGRFLIPAFVFNTLTSTLSKPPGVDTPSQPVKTFSELATKHPYKRLSKIKNVEIEISWFRSVCGSLPKRSFAGRLDGICRGFSGLPNLRTVTVTWQSYSADPARLQGVGLFNCLGKERTLDLLESFRKFQGERSEVVVTVEAPSLWWMISRNTTSRREERDRSLKEFMARIDACRWAS